MQIVVSPLHWGNAALLLDQSAFKEGYTHGRQYYFDDAGEAEEGPLTVTASSLLSLIATSDEHGYYQLDDGGDKSAFHTGVEQLLGVLVGYLSGPLHPETQQERSVREAQIED